VKRHGRLFERVVSWRNLRLAAARARRRKRRRPNVLAFEYHQEQQLQALREELRSQRYRPGPYRSFEIHEPKRRLISAAPYRDRVVHHAICAQIEPLFDQSFIHDSYACRRGKGTHAALDRAQQFARRWKYVLKADVARFFPSIDHDVLLGLVRRRLKDPRLLTLVELIVRHPFPRQQPPRYLPGDNLFSLVGRTCGLPLGNQTSQLFGNLMLDPLDHFIKEQLRCQGYVRYADDFLLFADDPQTLHAWRQDVARFLHGLRLRLNPQKSVVFPVSQGIPYLGMRLFADQRRLAKGGLTRWKRRWRRWQQAFRAGRLTLAEIGLRLQSWWGHAQHADAWRIASEILDRHPFTKAPFDPDPDLPPTPEYPPKISTAAPWKKKRSNKGRRKERD
jgi:RNA-directed DNA polymerase